MDNYSDFDLTYGEDNFGIWFSFPTGYNGGAQIINYSTRLCTMYGSIAGILGLDFIVYYDGEYQYSTQFPSLSCSCA